MKKTITLILLAISIATFAQTDSIRINKLENQIKMLKNADNIILEKNAKTKTDFAELKNDVIEYKEEHNNSWIEFINHWFIAVGTLLLLVFAIVGKKHFIENYQKKIKNEVENKIAELTNIEKDFIHKNLNEYKKHIYLKENAKIIVLNEKGTDFPIGFKKVLQLYKNYTEHKHKIDITGLQEALKPEIINKLREADVVIIENQVENGQHWNINIGYSCKTIKDIRAKSITGTASDREPFENNLHLIELCNQICDTTAVVYYGQAGKGNFPSNFVDSDKQHMITFANAPSQLYGNMLNMLKFKNELENA